MRYVRLSVAFVVLAIVAGVALPRASIAGSYVPPPGDALPIWSPDGTRIAFATSRAGQALAVISAAGGGETRLVEGPTTYNAAISPDWRWVAFTRFQAGNESLAIVGLDGSGERQLAASGFGTRPAWSPDSRTVAFRAADGNLSVVEIDGSTMTRIAPGGAWLAWSPKGDDIAFGGGSGEEPDLYLTDTTGTNLRLLAGGPGAQLEPKWSPDGTRIAFLTQKDIGKPIRFGVIRPDGTGLVTYPGPGVSNLDSFNWLPTSQGIVFSHNSSQGLFLLDLEEGTTTRLTTFGATPSPSPDGRTVAFAAGGECRDRYGIYVARSDGTHVRRLTNDCRVLGTPGDDVLRGTGLADVLLGLRGDDRIAGLSAGYVGDTLRGGDGNDVLVGTISGDLLRGGAGRDQLFGGLSADVLYGGSGPDRIDAQKGRDFVHARDGARDVVRCGTNSGGTPERDEVWADGIDQVARDCEIVHRRSR
jgi:Tol biopolymer transport system component